MKTTKNLKYYKDNCEEDYIRTPISVLRYIGELENAISIDNLPDFLYKDSSSGSIRIGVHSDADVTKNWEEHINQRNIIK